MLLQYQHVYRRHCKIGAMSCWVILTITFGSRTAWKPKALRIRRSEAVNHRSQQEIFTSPFFVAPGRWQRESIGEFRSPTWN